jgi:hypothetical protein
MLRIKETLTGTENVLRGLIAEAAKSGDYEGIDVARMTAGRVRDLISDLEANHSSTSKLSVPLRTSPTGPATNGSGQGPKKTKGVYPRFAVEDGVLCKVGWSKKEKLEYVHKIPRDAYENTIRIIGEIAGGKRLFTSQHIAEQLQSRGFTVPIYQVYLTLAVLREHKIIRKKGRDGYFSDRDVVALGGKLWTELGP